MVKTIVLSIGFLFILSCGKDYEETQKEEMVCTPVTLPFVGTIYMLCIKGNKAYQCTELQDEELGAEVDGEYL